MQREDAVCQWLGHNLPAPWVVVVWGCGSCQSGSAIVCTPPRGLAPNHGTLTRVDGEGL